jgi:hypothetical protein
VNRKALGIWMMGAACLQLVRDCASIIANAIRQEPREDGRTWALLASVTICFALGAHYFTTPDKKD